MNFKAEYKEDDNKSGYLGWGWVKGTSLDFIGR